uniref:Reverse transcriptase domain-containing protein n=1 Tax=Toxocara canis TaxID=6265 RepID=A0A183VDV5_TOXCA
LRFRQGEIALTADIEKAFLQLELQEPDRDACRFLWLRNPDDSDIQVDRKLQTYRFCRVPFGVVSSPFLLAAVLKTHLKGYTEEKAIAKNLYVDNIFVSAENSKEAERMYKRIKDIFNEASMNVREFASNDKRVTSSIKEEDRHKEQIIKILGMKWDTTTDEMIIEIESLERRPRTKRETLSYIAAQYDPLGLISPVILPLKLLLQDLWRKIIKWDDQFGGDETENIRRTLQGWKERREMRIPRKVSQINDKKEVHVFTDASEVAYAAAWTGPEWLQHQDSAWPSSEPIKNTKEEEEASLLEAGIEHK